MAQDATVEQTEGPVEVVKQVVALDYERRMSPPLQRFAEELRKGNILGHRCPQCGKVYAPAKGYCPLCCVKTTEADEVTVADRGTVVSFTIVTPIQYYGQQKTERYALATVLLDGADATLGQCELGEVELDDVRVGMRVEAVWYPESERSVADVNERGRGNIGGCIEYWRPTGEPDPDRETYKEHVL